VFVDGGVLVFELRTSERLLLDVSVHDELLALNFFLPLQYSRSFQPSPRLNAVLAMLAEPLLFERAVLDVHVDWLAARVAERLPLTQSSILPLLSTLQALGVRESVLLPERLVAGNAAVHDSSVPTSASGNSSPSSPTTPPAAARFAGVALDASPLTLQRAVLMNAGLSGRMFSVLQAPSSPTSPGQPVHAGRRSEIVQRVRGFRWHITVLTCSAEAPMGVPAKEVLLYVSMSGNAKRYGLYLPAPDCVLLTLGAAVSDAPVHAPSSSAEPSAGAPVAGAHGRRASLGAGSAGALAASSPGAASAVADAPSAAGAPAARRASLGAAELVQQLVSAGGGSSVAAASSSAALASSPQLQPQARPHTPSADATDAGAATVPLHCFGVLSIRERDGNVVLLRVYVVHARPVADADLVAASERLRESILRAGHDYYRELLWTELCQEAEPLTPALVLALRSIGERNELLSYDGRLQSFNSLSLDWSAVGAALERLLGPRHVRKASTEDHVHFIVLNGAFVRASRCARARLC
jgi:hypothetical protein